MGTTTLEELIQRIASTVGAGEEPINFTTTSGPDSSSIVSTTAGFRKTAATAYNGRDAVITDTTDDSAPEGEARVVTSFDGSSDLTTQAFSASLTSGDKITLLPKGLGLEDVKESVADVTRTLHLPRWLPFGLVPDGDMEGASEWNDVGTATVTKDTATMLLRQALKVVVTSDNNGVECDTFTVHEGDQLFFSVPIACVGGGAAQVELYDVGASAVISGTQYTTDEEGFADVRLSYVVESDVEQIRLRITQDGATSCTFYVGWASCLSSRQSIYDLPSAVKDVSNIEAIEYLPEGSPFENDSSRLFEFPLTPWPMDKPIRDYFATQRIQIATPRYEGPLFMRFSVTDTVLTTMAGTVYLSDDIREAAVDGMISNAFKKLASQQAGNEDRALAYKREARQHGKAYRALLDRLNMARPGPGVATQDRVRARSVL